MMRTEYLMGFGVAPATPAWRPKLMGAYAVRLRAKLGDESEPFLQSALNAASLRFRETLQPEPLFVDPYAGCFVSTDNEVDMKKQTHHYCLATKYIDDKLLHTIHRMDGLKQIVLLTDGMDTRPYRLNWPSSTLIFDISPDELYKKAAEKLEGVGAKISRSCLFYHIPLVSSNLQQVLHTQGFNGSRPSIWVIQGLPLINVTSFKDILFVVSSMAMNGSLFLGELPGWLAETGIGRNFDSGKWMDKLFMSNGFRVNIISYDEVARNFGKQLTSEEYSKILFVAEQLRFSDAQMETWRREFQRVEEEGDEEGFEEL
ncbi:O-methyltransferase 1, chloroplastic isoform X1 [Rhodamnia argentea]|uniref:O-methyltransferase 1, chloroplastic isoform X1 n=1 Tax=Rhodamnia argentea TaxID=178133 RepID=A0A8B8QAJ0_9MYRT|nr:O-methyltransferase 1, chloroplastic isoform X1 [Rhodamnia argentea]